VTSILSATGTVWVTAYGGAPAHRVVRVDAGTLEKLGSVSLGGVPAWETGGGGIRVAGADIWVAASGPEGSGGRTADGVVYRLRLPAGQTVRAFPVGGSWASDVAIGAGSIWAGVFTRGRAQLVRVEQKTGRVTKRIRLRSSYVRGVLIVEDTVVVDERYWEGIHGGPYVLLESFDAFTGRRIAVVRPRGDRTPEGLVHWRHQLWTVMNGSFVRLDPRTLEPVGDSTPGARSNGTGFAGSRYGIWYIDYRRARLSLFDPRTRSIRHFLRVRRFSPIAMDVGRSAVWLLGYEGTLTKLRVATP
jgi:hypothetical protein